MIQRNITSIYRPVHSHLGDAQGDIKTNSKPSAFANFFNTIKSQFSSTKLQINLKSQYSMTKTCAEIAARHDVKSGEPGMMRLDAMADGFFV
jgi:hypothetical protein